MTVTHDTPAPEPSDAGPPEACGRAPPGAAAEPPSNEHPSDEPPSDEQPSDEPTSDDDAPRPAAIDLLSPERIADAGRRYVEEPRETVTSIRGRLGINLAQFYQLQRYMGWPKRRPEGGRVAAPARRAAASCPDGASAAGAGSPFRALSPVASDLDADADVAEIAAAMRGLVRERVAELQAERGRGRRRGASGRMAAEIAPLARVLEQVLRIQNAYRTRETGDDGTHARRSLAELRDELYRRLVGDAGPGDGPGVCRGADAG